MPQSYLIHKVLSFATKSVVLILSSLKDMTKIAPTVLEEIQNQVDSVETINEDETIEEPTRNKIVHQEDSQQPSPNVQEIIEHEKGK